MSSSTNVRTPLTSQRPASTASIRPPSASVRPPSSASTRPSSSASIRPSISAPIRPSSSASIRPSPSTSSARPISRTSSRSSSRLTHRPSSRYSQRPSTRQSSRLVPLYQALVTQITGLTSENDQDNFRDAVDFVSKNLDQSVRPSANHDLDTVERHFRGHVQKARINANDTLGTALETSHRKFKSQFEHNGDLDTDVKMSRLPDHLQLLILLSLPPSQDTLTFADHYVDRIINPSKAAPTLTWKDILAEEPFEGQHWEGVYGLPPGSTVENWDAHSGGSTPSLSPFDDSDLDDSLSSSDILQSAEAPASLLVDAVNEPSYHPGVTYSHRNDVEELVAGQYWKTDWRTDASVERPFNICDASTLGPAVHRALGQRAALKFDGPSKEKYINEHDAVREVLMGLQGRRNLMFSWVHSGDRPFSFLPSSGVRLLHVSATAQMSILASFCRTATAVEHLRKFISAVFVKSPQARGEGDTHRPRSLFKQSTLTLEAFADALDTQVRSFDFWCASKEEEICLAQAGIGPPLVVSLLSLEKAIKDTFSAAFTVILDILREMVKRALRSPNPVVEVWILPEVPAKISPSAMTALLLDRLLTAVQEHTSMGDAVTSDALMHVFDDTAEPIWAMVGRWMKDGMPLREVVQPTEAQRFGCLEDEFFIEDNEMLMLDPDFWAHGFTLRSGQSDDGENRSTSVPTFLSHVAQHILAAGKAIGLLRALDVQAVVDRAAKQHWMAQWRPFKTLMASAMGSNTAVVQWQSVTTSTDNLSSMIFDELSPHLSLAQDMLMKVLVDECDLWLHLTAIEDLYLMRRGDGMSHFLDSLFARMDSRLPWDDFHFLNSAFRDVAEAGSQRWIDASLVRISHRGGKDKSITRTVRAIDGLQIEYAVPFPLTYIFGPRTMQVYSSIFSFVLQIRRAKNVLERILVRADVGRTSRSELKVFYAMRSKLSWFVNTLLNFIATNVLHTQLVSFHDALQRAKSLDEMIQLHNDHLSKIEGRCLLQRNTSALHRTIISILDMTLLFSDCFIAFAGDTTHDISRHSIIMMKRHRSRRVRHQRRNVIGFSQSFQALEDSSDSDSDFDVDLTENGVEPSFSLTASSAAGDDFLTRLDKISTELDILVRFVRRGVESLAAGTGEAAPAFGIFAFALEDWDR
ncbi:predicted protein [Sparassis crispa]|uniref:Spindle pole body component n=1 Tax=Sparassis crispa TaxID=139825 RepID=A0A401GC78_9APHY|nr:predicted protein [Sparassis crispa]GBE79798.1 predicted protein [Sparassis crispa]